MWYRRMTFRLKSVDETRSALLITQILENNKTAADNSEERSTSRRRFSWEGRTI